ncbi:phage tail protein [Desulfovibrio sp. SGI.169]|uniref:phage tail protein n=1 Tax=Desulfovibrio sp. SGI.169 TaxID=3420561 RepID=UPI003D005BC8
MSEEAPTYYAVLTDAGAELEAQALAEGKAVVLTHLAVGDANLQTVTPHPAVTELVHEVHRRPIDARSRDAADPKITLLHCTLPADVGGFWVQEIGVVGHLEGSEADVLYAYANHARYYKMLPQDGQTVTHEITIPIVQSTDARITIVVADEGYATRQEYRALSALVQDLRTVQRATWTLETAIEEGGALVLPAGLAYVPGLHVVSLSWDGIACHEGSQFTEAIPDEDGKCRSLTMLCPLPIGSDLEIVIHGHSAAPAIHE